jgi:hypothetical protein
MDSEESKSPFIIGLLRSFVVIFTLSILATTVAEVVVAQYAAGEKIDPARFAIDGTGLSYGFVFQIAGFSLVMAVWIFVIFSERLFIKMLVFWRCLLLFLATLISFSFFAAVFKWFPVGNLLLWPPFILGAAVCFGFSYALTVLKLKIDGEKYNKLLANFKAKHKV